MTDIIFDGEEVGPEVLKDAIHPVEIEFTSQGCIVTTLKEKEFDDEETLPPPAPAA